MRLGAGMQWALPCFVGLAASTWCAASIARDGINGGNGEPEGQGVIVPVAGEVGEKTDDKVVGKAFLSVDRLPAGGKCRVVMILDIDEGWNIKTNPPMPKNFIATTFTIKSKHGVALTDVRYPEGKKIADKKTGELHSVYDGRVMLYGTLEIPRDAAGKMEELELNVRYQACMGTEVCLVPKTIKLSGKLEVAEPGDPVKQINAKYFSPQAQK